MLSPFTSTSGGRAQIVGAIFIAFALCSPLCRASAKLAVYPTSTAVMTGTQQIFQPQLSGVPDSHSVTYEVDGIASGNAEVGTINSAGLYVAPKTAGTHTITISDSTVGQSANAAVLVYSQVVANFNARSIAGLHPIPSNLIGTGRMDSLRDTADRDLVKAGGISYARFYASIPQVFKTTTPDWTDVDNNVRNVSEGGVKVVLQMFQSPPWLLPKPNPCGSGYPIYDAMPTNLQKWGEMAVQYIKHLDETFPGAVTDYEIWNEPNVGSFCNPGASKLNDYMKLYDAVVPMMRAQIQADGSNARVGGPATSALITSWIDTMLADPVASQNIDFISYHGYLFDNHQTSAEWDEYKGVESVYQTTQDSGLGPRQTYLEAARLVAEGKQPQGKNLPIYETEYNLNWAFSNTCCRNNFTYAPVWNGMFIADLLDSVYSGAPNIMNHMVYFAATAPPYFCMVGEIDSKMDCAFPKGSTPQPYPQYFATQLIGSPTYLDLSSGGTMAQSVSPQLMGNGLVVTAFMTSKLDAILLVNPSQYTYSDLPVQAQNSGYTSAVATLYSISHGQSIQTALLPLKLQSGTSYSTTVTIPPYSVQAIAIRY